MRSRDGIIKNTRCCPGGSNGSGNSSGCLWAGVRGAGAHLLNFLTMDIYRAAILYHNYYSLEGIDEVRAKIAVLKRDDLLLLCSLPEKFAGQAPAQRANEK